MVFESFVKHGPLSMQIIALTRFLPNLHWDPKLRPMTLSDKPCRRVLDRHTEVQFYLPDAEVILTLWLPMLETNRNLTVAIGCTGGKHVRYIAEQPDYFASRGKTSSHAYRTLENVNHDRQANC